MCLYLQHSLTAVRSLSHSTLLRCAIRSHRNRTKYEKTWYVRLVANAKHGRSARSNYSAIILSTCALLLLLLLWLLLLEKIEFWMRDKWSRRICFRGTDVDERC